MSAIEHWVSAGLTAGGLAAFPLVFLGGLVCAFNPCCMSMAPAVVALVGINPGRGIKAASALSAFFVCGFASVTALMGGASVALGLIFGHWSRPLNYVFAAIPLLMALKLWGVIDLKAPDLLKELPDGRFGAAAAGAGFALVVAPCATPVLASILAYAALTKSIAYGTGLLFVYGIGLGAPLIAVGSLAAALPGFTSYRAAVNTFTGLCLAMLGLYLVWIA